ncbi:hypothetical protein T440DRAFT_278267 [Plenodomus tracheiphilus IPT5]|uniref:Uncharacterized protein n=1 Tax=Plenodomus tracheiphilus IPT5 TaxID=1408161 RepID=A0A6A7AQG3_9PLEO|nr:hypothetical protein T440DRAFT_278267 [Plenodomus tracheiphilus IPT5]
MGYGSGKVYMNPGSAYLKKSHLSVCIPLINLTISNTYSPTMRPSTLLTTLATLLTLSTALPSPKSTSTPVTFTLSSLTAYTPTLPSSYPLTSWLTFLITDGPYHAFCTATSAPNSTLSSAGASGLEYYDCEEQSEYPNVFFAFAVQEGWGGLVVKKMWDSKG